VSNVSQGPGWWLASDGRWYPPHLHPYTDFRGAQPERGDPKVWPAITLVSVGAACAIAGIVLFVFVGLVGLLGLRAHSVPGVVTIDCHVGDYYVFQHTGERISVPGFSYSNSSLPTLNPDEVFVTGPGGTHPGTWSGDGAETITEGSWVYSNTVGFHIALPGSYSVRIGGNTSTSVIVAPSLGSEIVRAAPWLILLGGGVVIAIPGAILLIVASVRRSRARKSLYYPWPYPPGPNFPQAPPPGT